MAIREKGKLNDLGIFFKPSFKCLKNKKISLLPAILKPETLLNQNVSIYYFILLYSQSAFDSTKKKKITLAV